MIEPTKWVRSNLIRSSQGGEGRKGPSGVAMGLQDGVQRSFYIRVRRRPGADADPHRRPALQLVAPAECLKLRE